MILDRKTGRREYLNMKNKGLPTNNIYSILPDGNGGLWIAALEYLLHYDIAQKSFSVVEKGVRARVRCAGDCSSAIPTIRSGWEGNAG